jgi:AraC-like DNA-binding protein
MEDEAAAGKNTGDEGYFSWLQVPKWYVWDGGCLLLGRSVGIVPSHQHHAIQVEIAVEGYTSVAGSDGIWRSGRGIIVRQDVEHSFNSESAFRAAIFVDPESIEGVWLRSSLSQDITILPESRLQCVHDLRTFVDRPFESMEVGALIRHCVQSLCAGAPPARRLDARVTRVLETIRASDDLRISLETAASQACLSTGRFAHLFKQQVGLPFRRYMLWRKLTRAVISIAREGTIAAAAQTADFADAAHLTRAFSEVFGVPPSVMMRGEFFEIQPPWSSGPGTPVSRSG